MKFEFYSSKKRKKLLFELNYRFGITEIPNILFQTGKDKIRAFSGNLSIDEIYVLDRLSNVEFMGLYLFKEELGHFRLGFDCTLLLNEQISKNFVEINEVQLERWIKGHNLDIALDKGIYVVRCGEDAFGCGLSDGKRLINFVPKERRIRRG